VTGECGWATFDTAIGRMAIAWGPEGVASVQLPDPEALRQRRRLQRDAPDAHDEAPPPAEARAAIDGIRALLRGEAVDLGFVRLDLRGVADFERRVYAAARAVPPGRVVTYGEIARQLGDPALARAVGRALARNPFAPVVPCHRVLGAGGRPGGFSAPGALATKLDLLHIERARFTADPGLFDEP
jgi:methylated-DNA-[protein]-cysteine S-methyltransferase